MSIGLTWAVAVAAAASLAVAFAAAWWISARRQRSKAVRPLPTEWALAGRPVFSDDERRVYRQLREALPHHIVLSKLPLVRFCQPKDPETVRYWFDLLGSTHVTFAVCSANGRVLAAIDLAQDPAGLGRAAQIKQAVLGACRVRYLRCPVDQLPSVPELQLLVPHNPAASRGPQPAPAVHQARATLATVVASRRRERTTLWQDSNAFNDSFFAPDSRAEVPTSEMGALVDASDPNGPPTQPPDLFDPLGLDHLRGSSHLRH